MYKILAQQISDSINIEAFQNIYKAELINSNHFELFYEVDSYRYVSVFKYGVVCFLDFNDTQINEFVDLISQQCKFFYDSELIKEYQIFIDADEAKYEMNKAELTYCDIEGMRLIMLNLAQSVALDYYFQQSRILLEETNKHTSFLEKKGTVLISGLELKKFIGKTLNLKNRIVENLHIFDSVPETWQNESLMKIDIGMKESLYMVKRSDNIHEELKIIREHLEYFSDIMNHSMSTKSEIIIIILVFIEVVDIVMKWIFH